MSETVGDDDVAEPRMALLGFEAEARRFQDVLTRLAVVSRPNLDAAVSEICHVAARALRVARVTVWRYDRSAATLYSTPTWSNGIPGWDVHAISETSHPVYWRALHSQRVLPVRDAVDDAVLAEFRADYTIPLGIGALLDTSIRADDRPLGIVCFEHVGGTREWSIAEQEFAASVGDRVGLALLVDEQRRLEADLRETQKMEALGLLAGGVAHDFNNVLNVIITSAELLEESIATGADVHEDLQSITVAAQRAASLTRKLLFIARREPMQREHIDINDCVRGFRQMATTILTRGVTVHEALAPDPLIVNADRTFVDQSLLNLVTNAAHAMGGQGELSIETSFVFHHSPTQAFGASLPAGRFARLTVRDSGTGIARDELQRIFEPFYSSKGRAGTGLGLAVVYGGMRQHEGHVAAESDIGVGTAIHLLFPLVDA
ncbi:MAG: ATP-binding protein [Gemmatimonadaceae bacterium]|nr:ATP-binding protein [Gemmatimonadaceae bacterium]